MDRSALAYWESFPAGRVRPIPAPIAPADEDIAFLERTVAAHAPRAPAAALLGVTPRIVAMRWPAGTSLVAVDWAQSMIQRYWSSAGAGLAAVRADWRELPFAARSRDIVVGDGCYAAMSALTDARLLNTEAHRVLRPGGLLSMRCFARPEAPIGVEAVFTHLEGGRFAHMFLFRWLLAMAVQGETTDGVMLDDVWRAWRERMPDPAPLLARLGWPADSAWGIERWKGKTVRFNFLPPSALRALAQPNYDVVDYHVPGYAWGECFPSLLLRARG